MRTHSPTSRDRAGFAPFTADRAPPARHSRDATAGVVAVIPARAGSRGVGGKNLALVGGRSLVARAVDACRTSGAVDEVVVTTDGERIAEEAARAGARVVARPAELADDHASSESAVLDALAQLRCGPPAVVVFAQATSPFIEPAALARAVERVGAGECDVIFSAVATHEFVWRAGTDGTVTGVNHDPARRPRRQDRCPDWRETGAFYVMDGAGFLAAGHRFFGRVGVEPVDEASALEIDAAHHLELARLLATRRVPPPSVDLGAVELLVTDFDGVHTDDRVRVDQDGRESVTASRSDGHGISLLRHAGVRTLIVSTETNPVVAARARKLDVECLQGLDDKWSGLRRWLCARGVEAGAVAYLGNDVNDLACLAGVGYPLAVADAHPAVVDAAVYVTARRGGHGAVREVADRILAGRPAHPSEGAC